MFTAYQDFILIINVHVKKKVMFYLSFFVTIYIPVESYMGTQGPIRASLQVRLSSSVSSMAAISEKLNNENPALRVLVVR